LWGGFLCLARSGCQFRVARLGALDGVDVAQGLVVGTSRGLIELVGDRPGTSLAKPWTSAASGRSSGGTLRSICD